MGFGPAYMDEPGFDMAVQNFSSNDAYQTKQ